MSWPSASTAGHHHHFGSFERESGWGEDDFDLAEAEEFLSLANWSVLKNPDCSNHMRSQLHRNFGKLYSAQGRLEEALVELAKDIYCASLEVGPEHIDTSAGYYHAASIFYTQHRIENALAFYDKVVDIWYKCLAAVLSNGPGAAQPPALSDAKGSEGIDMLGQILRRREECVGETNIATGESYYILGLLQQYMQQHSSAATCIRAALAIYQNQLGPEHRSTKDVATSLAQLESSSSSADS